MLFEGKKLQLESVEDMIQRPVQSIEPYSLMLAPIYVLMKLNQKLVSVKAPLDFFTPPELERLKGHQHIYVPKFVDSAARFQSAARLVKNLLTSPPTELPAAPFEMSRESFYVLRRLWGKKIRVEPFFMSVFSDQLCSSLDPEKMVWARESAVVLHDRGILLSGAFVFIALHCGCHDLNFLNEQRQTIYSQCIQGQSWDRPRSEVEMMIRDLNRLLEVDRSVNLLNLKATGAEWSRKLSARLALLKDENANETCESATIHGEGGFAA